MCITVILGPCGFKTIEEYIKIGQQLHNIISHQPLKFDFIYKSSFDKANRTSLHGERGIGLKAGIEAFHCIKQEVNGIKLTTDVHECCQVEQLAPIIDVIQIPAFLCRQTDLIVECARHFDIINIKKGQWLGPNNLAVSVDKIRETNGSAQAWITDRGSNFGYDKLIVDFTIIDELKRYYDKVILDCTHSTQRSRKVHGVQGDVKLAKQYFRAAPIFEYDGVFAETHPQPQECVSDKDCQIPLDEMNGLLTCIL